jgi:ribosomal protein S18 acetylase RimI-like enzyme
MMHADIRIREATVADSAELLSLVQWAMRVYADLSGIASPLDAMRETLTDMQWHIRQDHVLVAEHKGHLVGTVRLIRKPDGTAYFSRFAVHPNLQRSGVGGLLYAAAERWLIQQGIRQVELHTALANDILVSFYRNRGFELVATDHSRGYARGTFRKILG